MKRIFYFTMTTVLLSLLTYCDKDTDDEEEIIIPTTLTVDKTSLSVGEDAVVESFTVTSNKDWTLKNDATWISLSLTSGKADSKLKVDLSISANPETTERKTTITITAEDKTANVEVVQKGKTIVVVPGIEIADEKFERYLLEHFDTDANDKISTEEAEKITKIDVTGKEIASLGGIENLVNLDTLIVASNALTSIDLSKNTLLIYLDCSSNQLDSLGLSSNTKLKFLNCSSNKLTALDLSANPELTYVNFSGNRITDIDLSQNGALKTLNCSGNELDSLNIGNNTALETLNCSNNNLTVLDVSHNPALNTLNCTNNPSLEKIILAKDQVIANLSHDPATFLEYPEPEKVIVKIPDAKFKAYLLGRFDADKDGEISEDEALTVKDIRCGDMGIASVEGLAAFVNLEVLYCGINNLTSLDVSKNTKLKELNCTKSSLVRIDVSNNPALTLLNCSYCELVHLDVGANTALTELNCSNNKILTLDVSKNTKLQRLLCQSNLLSTLDLRNNLSINYLNCQSNPNLTTLFLDQDYVIPTLYMDSPPTTIIYPNYAVIEDEVFMQYLLDNYDTDNDGRLTEIEAKAVKIIDCPEMNIKSLKGIESFPNITYLNCSGNELTSLDISSNKALETLKCDSNQLTTLNVAQNTALKILTCSKNQLTSLNVGANVNLTTLICNGNNLTSLNLTANTKLDTLMVQDNNLQQVLYLNTNTALNYVDCRNNPKLRKLVFKAGHTVETVLMDSTTSIDYFDDNIYAIIADENFNKYLVDNFDRDGDGAISKEEAKRVTRIECHDSGINSLAGIEYFTELTILVVSNNNLTSLDVTSNTKLIRLYCYDNDIYSLDVSYCPELRDLSCGFNNISVLNLSKNPKLATLECSGNNLSALNVRSNGAIQSIACTNNRRTMSLMMLDLSRQNPSLQIDLQVTVNRLSTPYNALTFEDLTLELYLISRYDGIYDGSKDGGISAEEADLVTKIECIDMGIKSLVGLEAFHNLKELDCSVNELKGAVNLSAIPSLTHVNCSLNQITSLNLSANTNLVWIECSENIMSAVDVSNSNLLTYLGCVDNKANLKITINTLTQKPRYEAGTFRIDKDETAEIIFVP